MENVRLPNDRNDRPRNPSPWVIGYDEPPFQTDNRPDIHQSPTEQDKILIATLLSAIAGLDDLDKVLGGYTGPSAKGSIEHKTWSGAQPQRVSWEPGVEGVRPPYIIYTPGGSDSFVIGNAEVYNLFHGALSCRDELRRMIEEGMSYAELKHVVSAVTFKKLVEAGLADYPDEKTMVDDGVQTDKPIATGGLIIPRPGGEKMGAHFCYLERAGEYSVSFGKMSSGDSKLSQLEVPYVEYVMGPDGLVRGYRHDHYKTDGEPIDRNGLPHHTVGPSELAELAKIINS